VTQALANKIDKLWRVAGVSVCIHGAIALIAGSFCLLELVAPVRTVSNATVWALAGISAYNAFQAYQTKHANNQLSKIRSLLWQLSYYN
jgi:hypothetical protein